MVGKDWGQLMEGPDAPRGQRRGRDQGCIKKFRKVNKTNVQLLLLLFFLYALVSRSVLIVWQIFGYLGVNLELDY